MGSKRPFINKRLQLSHVFVYGDTFILSLKNQADVCFFVKKLEELLSDFVSVTVYVSVGHQHISTYINSGIPCTETKKHYIKDVALTVDRYCVWKYPSVRYAII